MKNGTYVIVNLDKSGEKGSHWISIAKFPNGKVLIYDSFGRSLKQYGIKGVNSDLTDREQKSKLIGDKIEELSCGQQSLAWLIVCHRNGYDMAKLI